MLNLVDGQVAAFHQLGLAGEVEVPNVLAQNGFGELA
jgi:hypothetical protein